MTDGAISWHELAIETAQRLAAGGIDEAEQHGRWIVMRACGAEDGEWASLSTDLATVRGVAAIDAMTARRLGGEPLQYVLGEWSFRYLDLFIDQRVLIPRPETEIVAGAALAEIRRLDADLTLDRPLTVVDLGTGSGAIGLSIASEHDDIDVWLTDVSAPALAVAQANIAGLGRAGARVRIAQGWWFDALPEELRGNIDVLVSNPPYVADHESLPSAVADWEPSDALFAGPKGTEHLDLLVDQAPDWLAPHGSLVLEMAPWQVESIVAKAATRFEEAVADVDLTNRLRAVIARRSQAEVD